MTETRCVNLEWPHTEWWDVLLTIYLQRLSFHELPLQACWIPSHVCDDIPFECITRHDALKHNTTLQNIFHNRTADTTAKSTLKTIHGQLIHDFHKKQNDIFQWHLWLARLAQALPTKPKDSNCISIDPIPDQPSIEPSYLPHELTVHHSVDAFAKVLQRGEWRQDPSTFNLTFANQPIPELKSYASITTADWNEGIRFFQSLRWKVSDGASAAFVELAFHAYYAKYKFSCDNPAKLATMLRKIYNQCQKIQFELCPGVICHKSKCTGKLLPAGRILNAEFLWSDQSKKHLAVYAIKVKTHKLSAWNHHFT